MATNTPATTPEVQQPAWLKGVLAALAPPAVPAPAAAAAPAPAPTPAPAPAPAPASSPSQAGSPAGSPGGSAAGSPTATYDSVSAVRLHVVTPVPRGGGVPAGYVERLLATLDVLREADVAATVALHEGGATGNAAAARNALLAAALADPAMTHVACIDADVVWRPRDVLRMVDAGLDVVGALVPAAGYAWERAGPERVAALAGECARVPNLAGVPAAAALRHHLVDYAIVPAEAGGSLAVEAGVVKVARLPPGLLLVSRAALERLVAAAPPGRRYADPATGAATVALFEPAVEEGALRDEVATFCARWRALGGAVHADLAAETARRAPEEFVGRPLSVLRFG